MARGRRKANQERVEGDDKVVGFVSIWFKSTVGENSSSAVDFLFSQYRGLKNLTIGIGKITLSFDLSGYA